ncbi:MAG: CPBP family intramembrane glutamic endopeptidase [Bacillota bacterium]
MTFKRLFDPLEKGILMIYILTFLMVPVIQVIALNLFPDLLENNAALTSFSAGLNLLWYLVLTFLLFKFARIYLFKNQWVYFKDNPGRSFSLIILGLFLMFSMNMFISSGFTLFGQEVGSQNQAALEELILGRTFDMIAIVLFAGILAPIAEEIVFRKGLYGIIYRKFGNVAAIILSGILFGLIHMTSELTNVVGMIPYFGLGIILSYIYYFSSKMIFVPIVVHGVMNILSIAAIFTL